MRVIHGLFGKQCILPGRDNNGIFARQDETELRCIVEQDMTRWLMCARSDSMVKNILNISDISVNTCVANMGFVSLYRRGL